MRSSTHHSSHHILHTAIKLCFQCFDLRSPAFVSRLLLVLKNTHTNQQVPTRFESRMHTNGSATPTASLSVAFFAAPLKSVGTLSLHVVGVLVATEILLVAVDLPFGAAPVASSCTLFDSSSTLAAALSVLLNECLKHEHKEVTS